MGLKVLVRMQWKQRGVYCFPKGSWGRKAEKDVGVREQACIDAITASSPSRTLSPATISQPWS